MKLFLIITLSLLVTSATSNAQTEGLRSITPSESQKLKQFVEKVNPRLSVPAKSMQDFFSQIEKDLKVDVVVIRFPKWMGGSDIGYMRTVKQTERDRETEIKLTSTLNTQRTEIVNVDGRRSTAKGEGSGTITTTLTENK